jgi:allantoin racemase
MRLLLANPNTTSAITDLMAVAARRVAMPGTEIKPVTAQQGAAVIGSRMEMLIGDYASLEMVAQEGDDCDAIIIAASIDSGLRAVRQMMSVPVIGLTEAALHAACLCGGRFGLVVSTPRTGVIMREMVEGYGLASRLAGVRHAGAEPQALMANPDEARQSILRATRELVEQDLAEAVILIGAVMAGIPEQIRDEVPVPVLEGVSCAVPMAEALARMGLRKARTGSFAMPAGRVVTGIAPTLQARFRT